MLHGMVTAEGGMILPELGDMLAEPTLFTFFHFHSL
jgi:hypothetical protein